MYPMLIPDGSGSPEHEAEPATGPKGSADIFLDLGFRIFQPNLQDLVPPEFPDFYPRKKSVPSTRMKTTLLLLQAPLPRRPSYRVDCGLWRTFLTWIMLMNCARY